MKKTLSLLMMVLLAVTARARTETVTFSNFDFEDHQSVSTIHGETFYIVFEQATNPNNTPPVYYADEAAIHVFCGNYFTVLSDYYKGFSKIEFTFGDSDGSNTITIDKGTYDSGIWTGDATTVRFTIGGITGFRSLTAVTVTFDEEPATIATPVITLDPPEGPYPEGTTVTANITCETDGALIYYRIDNGDWILGKSNIPLTRSCTITARAVTATEESFASKTVTFMAVVNSIAEFYELEEGTDFIFNAPVTVVAKNMNSVYVQDDSPKGMWLHGVYGRSYSFGDIIPGGFYGKRQTYGWYLIPWMLDPKGLQDPIASIPPEPMEIKVNEVGIDNAFRYVLIKNVTFGEYSIIGNADGSVPFFNCLGQYIPTDNREYDVKGLVDYTSFAQILPMSITPSPVVQPTYTVTIAPTEHGTVFMDNIYNESTPGTIVELYPTPDYGYELDSESFYYTYDPNPGGAFFTIEDNKFEMPESNVIVYATFKPVNYNIGIDDSDPNGYVRVVDNKATAQYNETVSVKVYYHAGYELDDIRASYEVSGGTGYVDFEPVPNEPNQYTFVMPAADVIIKPTFRLHYFNITADPNIEHGSVSIEPEKATMGQVVRVTTTANPGCGLVGLFMSYQEETPDGTETKEYWISNGEFTMPPSDVVVTAVFLPTIYNIDTTVIPANTGTITAPSTAGADTEVEVSTTPAEGYQLKRLYYYFDAGGGMMPEFTIENGVFLMPPCDITIAAEFEPAEPATYSINVAAAENGTVEASPTSAHQGDEVVLTVTPDEGYELENLTVTTVETEDVEPQPGKAAENVELTKTGEFTYAFVMPGKSVNVTATFKQSPLTGINGIRVDLHEGMRFVNPLGQVSNRPFRGVNIVIDGDKTYKVVF